MDHQVSPEPENGHSEEEEEADPSDVDTAQPSGAASKLFTFSIVNSYGTANISPLPCDGNILKLNRKLLLFVHAVASQCWIQAPPTSPHPSYLQHIPRWPSTGTRS